MAPSGRRNSVQGVKECSILVLRVSDGLISGVTVITLLFENVIQMYWIAQPLLLRKCALIGTLVALWSLKFEVDDADWLLLLVLQLVGQVPLEVLLLRSRLFSHLLVPDFANRTMNATFGGLMVGIVSTWGGAALGCGGWVSRSTSTCGLVIVLVHSCRRKSSRVGVGSGWNCAEAGARWVVRGDIVLLSLLRQDGGFALLLIFRLILLRFEGDRRSIKAIMLLLRLGLL